MCPPLAPTNKLHVSDNMKPVVYTLHEGKLIPVAQQGTLTYVEQSAEDSSEITGAEDEIHIEIIRETSLQPCCNVKREETINNVSSAYEAFWKADFDNGLDRRTCLKCKQVFLTPQQLLYHLQYQHELAIPEQCFMCLKHFTDTLEKVKHLKQIHNIAQPDSTCEVCFEVFGTEEGKGMHRVMHNATVKCKWCPETFPSKYLLNQHLWHCVLKRETQDCHICGCHFRSSHIRQLHCLRHNPISCEICHVKISSLASECIDGSEIILLHHIRSFHSDEEIQNYLRMLKKQDEEEETLDELFMSQVQCNLTQVNGRDMLDNNHLVDTEESLLKDTLSHKATHNSNLNFSEKSLQCSECLKIFDNNEELVKHEVEHQSAFSCHVCKKMFFEHKGLKEHVRSHGMKVERKPVRYKCKFCSLSCPTLGALRTHVLTHTDLKPYLCDKCGLKFRRPNTLKLHQVNIHDSRSSVSCPFCCSTSLSKKSLNRHIQNVHCGVRRFICGVCGVRFVQNQDLRRHLKSTHQLDIPPLSSIAKKSNTEVHVIPAATNLDPGDPLVSLLKSAVEEEEFKLEAICQKRTRSKPNQTKPNHESLVTLESCVEEGQSLSILGDVASKATPLDNTNGPPDSLNIPVSSSQQATKLLCAENESDDLQNVSSLITQCKQDQTMSKLSQENSFKIISDSTTPVISLLSALNSNSSCQFYLLSKENVQSGIGEASATIRGSVPSVMTSTYIQSLNINDDLEGDSTQIFSVEEPPEIVEIGSLSSSNLPPVDFLYPHEDFIASVNSIDAIDNVNRNSQRQCELSTGQTNLDIFRDDSETLVASHEELSEFNVRLNDGIVNAVLKRNMQCQTLALIDLLGKAVPNGSCKGAAVMNNNSNLTKSEVSLSRPPNLLTDSEVSLKCTNVVKDKNIDLKTCPECGKAYTNNGSLQRHIKIHSDNKRAHTCSYCGKHFQYRHNLAVHLVSHSGDRPYKCSLCKKTFRYHGELKEHKLLHEQSHPYTCEDCGQNFTRQRDLKRHMLQSHIRNEKPVCHICNKSYSRVDYLNKHIKMHEKSGDIQSIPQNPNNELQQDNISHLRKSRKLNQQNVTLFVCELCSSSFSSEAEKVAHQSCCEEESTHLYDNSESGQALYDEVGAAPSSSEDLVRVPREEMSKVRHHQYSQLQSTSDKDVLYVQIIAAKANA